MEALKLSPPVVQGNRAQAEKPMQESCCMEETGGSLGLLRLLGFGSV